MKHIMLHARVKGCGNRYGYDEVVREELRSLARAGMSTARFGATPLGDALVDTVESRS